MLKRHWAGKYIYVNGSTVLKGRYQSRKTSELEAIRRKRRKDESNGKNKTEKRKRKKENGKRKHM
jgi:hypothetical protein